MTIYEQIADEVQKGDAEAAGRMIEQALEKGETAERILYDGLVEGMNVVSEKFKNNECFIPEVLVSARAMNQGLDRLKPLLAAAKVEPRGKIVIGSIQGDLHDIGKNIVGMLLQGAGYEIIDLGADVSVQKFVDAAKEREADVVGMSSLLTTTMVNMQSVISGLEGAGIRPDVKVIIGGAPVTAAFAEQIGADGYAAEAAAAIDLVDGLLGKQPR
ncbi:MAG: B12-binding domain-containing protein [Candidatus Aminicenantaceae bacterium]